MRGDVVFDALGGRWALFLGTAAQCGLEEEYDRGYLAVLLEAMPSLDPGDLEDKEKLARAAVTIRKGRLRSIVYWGLKKHHPSVTLDGVNDILDDLGDAKMGDVIGRALAAALDQGQSDAGEAAARPGKPRTRKSARTGSA